MKWTASSLLVVIGLIVPEAFRGLLTALFLLLNARFKCVSSSRFCSRQLNTWQSTHRHCHAFHTFCNGLKQGIKYLFLYSKILKKKTSSRSQVFYLPTHTLDTYMIQLVFLYLCVLWRITCIMKVTTVDLVQLCGCLSLVLCGTCTTIFNLAH